MRRTRSLIGTAARTAVITGTAKAVVGKGNSQTPPVAAAAPVAAPAGMTDDKVAMLQKLSDLQKSGVLTEEEFAGQKAKILSA